MMVISNAAQEEMGQMSWACLHNSELGTYGICIPYGRITLLVVGGGGVVGKETG